MTQTSSQPPRQPWLHDLSITVDGNRTVVSARSGDLEPGTVQGLYVDDRRILNRLELEVGAEPPTPMADRASGARGFYLGSARSLGDTGPDPTVEVLRERVLGASAATGVEAALTERITVTSRAAQRVVTFVRVVLGGDGLDIGSIKAGHLVAPQLRPVVEQHDVVRIADDWHETQVVQHPTPTGTVVRDGCAVLETDVVVEPGESVTLTVTVTVTRVRPSAFDADPGAAGVRWDEVAVGAADQRFVTALDHGLDDLQHLLLRDPLDPADVFAGAGTPWYLTLFGRDSLWAARMLLPFGVELAHGTLRTLARRQGTRSDPRTGESPGKIPHELRRHVLSDPTTGMTLPQVYYGTIDATALWVTLLAEARAWGLSDDRVVELLPALRSAVRWLMTDSRPDGDGLLKYLDATGTGLANQGWKDSGDAIRWRDGRVADGPIALVEAQAYAVEALTAAARLYRELGLEGADVVEAEAVALAERLRSRFWVETDAGRHLAIALDGAGEAVDGLASNMGHVLGTGALTATESDAVVATLMGDELRDAFGVRTFGTGNGGFNPIGYHTGSIWTHDTAIIAWNMARSGHGEEAGRVARSLVDAAAAFDYRWPELYSGVSVGGRPTPYPASCRPQAWAAASAAVLVQVALGLAVDAPEERVRIVPPVSAPFGALDVRGLRYRGHPFDVTVSADRVVTTDGLPSQVVLETPQGRGPVSGGEHEPEGAPPAPWAGRPEVV